MARYAHDEVVPFKHSVLDKKEQVSGMFDNISFRYDLLNKLLSFGRDKGWRRKAVLELREINPKVVLDVATGTGDLALMAYRLLRPQKVVGIDISEGMLELGRKKIRKLGLDKNIELLKGDSEAIFSGNNTFDAVTVGFGVRNFQDLEKGISEMLRILKPGGKLVVLEFSKPKTLVLRSIYKIYMKFFAPWMGKFFSKNCEAYQYLNESIQKFPEGKDFIDILARAGFRNTYSKPLSFGICSIYCGIK